MVSSNDIILLGLVLILIVGIFRLFPKLWKAKVTIFLVLLLLFVIGASAAYGAYEWWKLQKHLPYVHEWVDTPSYDLHGNPIDPKQYE